MDNFVATNKYNVAFLRWFKGKLGLRVTFSGPEARLWIHPWRPGKSTLQDASNAQLVCSGGSF